MEETVKEVTTVAHVEPEKVVTTKKVVPAVKTEHPQVTYEKKKTIFRTYQLVWFLVGIIEVLLGFRFVLKMIGANPFSGFTALIYAASAPFAYPFQGIVQNAVTGASVIEWSTIIAMLVFLVLGWGIVQLLSLIKPVTPEEVAMTVDSV